MKKIYTIILLISLANLSVLFAQFAENNNFNCFSILAGKNATIDNSVIFAHNEDDYGTNLVDWYKVPRISYEKNKKLTLVNGAKIEQVRQTYSYIWMQMPGFKFSDTYMNEFGLTVASNSCPSKEKNGELLDGGIGFYLRRIMVERAKTSREAVKIAGKIVEEVGYSSSGRSYCIADANEAWIMSVVQGKHWVAQRIPDNEIAIIPNYYVIEEIDLNDSMNFLGSADIIDYAIERAWYEPSENKPFNFRLAYGKVSVLESKSNISRKWRAMNYFSKKEYEIDSDFPFSFVPKQKVSIQDLMLVLHDHYEKGKVEDISHKDDLMRICSETNQYGFVAQLRNSMPSEIGCVLWIAPRRPCVQAFVPWYCGISEIPKGFSKGNFENALLHHFEYIGGAYEKDEIHSFWKFVDFVDDTENYSQISLSEVKKKKAEFEDKIISNQSSFEKEALEIFKKDRKKAIAIINNYTKKSITKAIQLIEKEY
ncbi:MAG: hypothetical protein HN704_05070 [Bacteroidetes bacterium]|jgi:dipeptidase|nr:hypothetical protein [Bacteroidota bacterium]MBT6685894.1 hypothetical protein [Bacteroidota bacterium]MBT7144042.1 hypothetical protein [Bacteroidota bacterium]MBT7490964.1 hypothetical protein [Bacteroidota bacterium]